MMQTKEELIERVIEILSKKSFTEQAKENLLGSIVFAFICYNPPKYITKSRYEYIEEYLRVLENMKGYAVIELSEINEANLVSTEFRKHILKLTSQNGNLDFINGKYTPAQNGQFYCTCKGFAWKPLKMMFTLAEDDVMQRFTTIHHEMTHLTEGENTFPIRGSIPFAFELREMFYEGRATTHESYTSVDSPNIQVDNLEDGVSEYQIVSAHHYPLYGTLYQTLQIIFDDEILEEMSKNGDYKSDMIKELEKRYPNIPVLEVFSHLIYILSCNCKEGQEDILKNAIHYYVREHQKKIEWIVKALESVIDLREKSESDLKKMKQEELNYMQSLGNPASLKKEYEEAYQEAKVMIEELYHDGSYTEEQYRKELESLEQEGTLEYYREVKEQELQNNRNEQKRTKERIIKLEKDIEIARHKIKRLEQDCFPSTLEQICLKNPSLQSSFAFLKHLALQKVSEEKKGIPEGDARVTKLLDKIRVLYDLQKRIVIVPQEKNTRLVS